MEINEQELKRRLESSKNLTNSLLVPREKQAPEIKIVIPEKPQKTTLPVDINTKILAGALAKQGIPPREISHELDITIGQVISAKKTSNPDVAIPRDASIARVRELALSKTMEALGLMTPDKFANANLKDLAQVAKDMAHVVEKTTPREAIEDNRIQFVVFAPEMKSESHYKVLDV